MRVIGLAVVLTLNLILGSLAVEAQQAGKVWRIGYLTPFSRDSANEEALRQGLRDLGYVVGRNLVIETRAAEQRYDDLPKLATELIAANVEVIVASTGISALAAKRVTSTIPIVMAASADAVAQGIVASLARPGGNITGLTALTSIPAPKRLEIQKETLPRLRRAAAIWCPGFSNNQVELELIQAAAKTLRLQVEALEYTTPASWDTAKAALLTARPDALVLLDCTAVPFDAVLEFALQHRIPTISPFGWITRRGGLLSYGADNQAMSRRAAVFVDKILKGVKPTDLPVEQPTKFDLVVNLKTAKALGLTIPQSLVVRADEIIQ